ncbi:hypothetical protein WICMUC_000453 [Wickerhamomyces mucosus]|uniref:Uncharacterized protein n=1 Tax=Wickerhamomyces mucosus TaxID=1378264 RepID=A0A9P8TJ51_9ASCO|nr:hypothetical protein WICMUC_000453 [Wickerhamomyces mucosus]
MTSQDTKTKLKVFYRSVAFQAVIIGLISFTQPGIRGAIGFLGAGGLAKPSTSNVSNALMFAMMAAFAPFFSILTNKAGVKPVAFVGGMGGVFVSSALYENSRSGNQWYIYLGSIISGIFTAAFWTSEATVCILYPDDRTRGLFIGIWQGISKVGGVIAGAIAFSLNLKGTSAKEAVSLNTYIVLFSIQCLGPFLALLLSNPEKLHRKDGRTLRTNITQESLKQRFQAFSKIFKRKEILFLTPLFLVTTFWKPFESNYMAKHFTVRVRGLNSLLTSIVQLLTDVGMAVFLDNKWTSKKIKARYTWIGVNILMVAFFVYSIYIQYWLDHNPQPRIDWNDAAFRKTYIPMVVFIISGEACFNWLYWIIGYFHFSPAEVSLISGFIRSTEALGQTISYAIAYTHPNLLMNVSLSAGLYFAAAPFVTYGIWKYVDNEEVQDYYNSDSELQLESGEFQDERKNAESISVASI